MADRILLVEDNPSLSHMLHRFLIAKGFAVSVANSGSDALQTLFAETIDLLVLDLRLPDINGIEILQMVRKSPKLSSLPVIIMTGVLKGEKLAASAAKFGVQHFLEKPFTQEAFLSTIRTALPERNSATHATTTLLGLISDIYNHRRSGILNIAPQGTTIVFVKGEPASFTTRGRDEFPAFLVARHKISQEDSGMFVSSGEERIFLTQSGLLTFEELVEESRLFLTRRLQDSLAANSAAEFREVKLDPELPLVQLSVPRLVYESSKSSSTSFNTDMFMSRFGTRYPARTPLYFRRVNLIDLQEEDVRILDMINGRRAVKDLVSDLPGHNRSITFFNFLLAMGMIELHLSPVTEAEADFPLKRLFNRPLESVPVHEEKSEAFEDLVEELSDAVDQAVAYKELAAPLSNDDIDFEQLVQRDHSFIRDKNYYEIFGLSRSSYNFQLLKEAYFQKTRQYSADKFMTISGSTQAMAQEILSLYANAYNTLSSVVAKERYDEMLNSGKVGLDGKQDDRLQARIQFQSGKVFLEMEDFSAAEKALQDAYILEPNNPLNCAYLAWAIYNNPSEKSSQVTQNKVKMLLAKSLQQEKLAEAYAFRGCILLDEGRNGLAEGEFQKALKINPTEPHARKGMQKLTAQHSNEKKGFLKRLFG